MLSYITKLLLLPRHLFLFKTWSLTEYLIIFCNIGIIYSMMYFSNFELVYFLPSIQISVILFLSQMIEDTDHELVV